MRPSRLPLLLIAAALGCAPPVAFEEVEAPLRTQSIEPARSSGGFALADFDDDGALDLVFAAGYSLANLLGAGGVGGAAAGLLLGAGDGTFAEAAVLVDGVTITPAPADLDGDGDLDLVLTTGDASDDDELASPDLLFENDGGALVARGELPASVGTGYAVCPADFDGDGDLDLYVANHTDTDALRFDNGGFAIGQRDRLYRNDGDFNFVDVSDDIGELGALVLWTNACLADDVDGDGDVDLWVAYENTPRGVTLWENRGGLEFVDVSAERLGDLAGKVGNWMGFAAGDYDGDLDVDVFVTNMGWGAYSLGGTTVTAQENGSAMHALLENQGDGTFVDVAPDVEVTPAPELPQGFAEYPERCRGLACLDFGWTAWFEDLDNDGDEDLYFAGAWAVSDRSQIIGVPRTGANAGRVLLNEGGSFRDVSAEAGARNVDDEGFILNAWGSAIADLDDDGVLDLAVANQDFGDPAYPGGVRVWRGATDRASLALDLRGAVVGTLVEVRAGARVQRRRVHVASSISGPRRAPLHFGLGDAVEAEVVVTPPGGDEQVHALSAGKHRIEVRP